jgi:hypothetical protein
MSPLIKHALDVPVQCPQHADARMHQRPAIFAAINSASIAACHSSDCRGLPGDKAMMYLAASLSVRSVLPPGRVIGSSKRRDQVINSCEG